MVGVVLSSSVAVTAPGWQEPGASVFRVIEQVINPGGEQMWYSLGRGHFSPLWVIYSGQHNNWRWLRKKNLTARAFVTRILLRMKGSEC